ncbi:MAG: putative collagen-binding domain-containing protein, partial [Bacteroidales bacterium]
DGSFALIYSPRGAQFTIDKSFLTGAVVSESWFDPRYGITHRIHASHTKGIQTYTPPTSGRGNDWLLILQDVEMEDGNE